MSDHYVVTVDIKSVKYTRSTGLGQGDVRQVDDVSHVVVKADSEEAAVQKIVAILEAAK